jgi:hypothetical protein
MRPLHLDQDGAELRPLLAETVVEDLLRASSGIPQDRPGWRITAHPPMAPLLGQGSPVGASVCDLLGPSAKPVRAILFDKSQDANWSLGWHQDRTIAVRERSEVPGFRSWNVKQGIIHVEPPFALLEGMVTVRIHLDDVDMQNGPLEIILGSHRHGRLEEHELGRLASTGTAGTCLARRATSGCT